MIDHVASVRALAKQILGGIDRRQGEIAVRRESLELILLTFIDLADKRSPTGQRSADAHEKAVSERVSAVAVALDRRDTGGMRRG